MADSSKSVMHPQNCPISIKLFDANYLIWRQQELAVVTGYDLESHLTGKPLPPPQFIKDSAGKEMDYPDYQIWHKQDQFLSAWF